jgi:hypothetical protein
VFDASAPQRWKLIVQPAGSVHLILVRSSTSVGVAAGTLIIKLPVTFMTVPSDLWIRPFGEGGGVRATASGNKDWPAGCAKAPNAVRQAAAVRTRRRGLFILVSRLVAAGVRRADMCRFRSCRPI